MVMRMTAKNWVDHRLKQKFAVVSAALEAVLEDERGSGTLAPTMLKLLLRAKACCDRGFDATLLFSREGGPELTEAIPAAVATAWAQRLGAHGGAVVEVESGPTLNGQWATPIWADWEAARVVVSRLVPVGSKRRVRIDCEPSATDAAVMDLLVTVAHLEGKPLPASTRAAVHVCNAVLRERGAGRVAIIGVSRGKAESHSTNDSRVYEVRVVIEPAASVGPCQGHPRTS